jgi:hypothetical protein
MHLYKGTYFRHFRRHRKQHHNALCFRCARANAKSRVDLRQEERKRKNRLLISAWKYIEGLRQRLSVCSCFCTVIDGLKNAGSELKGP